MAKPPPPKVPIKVPAKTKAKARPKRKSRAKAARKPGEPKRGPLPWKPAPEDIAKIRLYAGLGSTQDQIASLIGKSVATLVKHPEVQAAFESGKAETIAKVAGTLVKKALGGDTASAIFYLKTQAGWRETVRNEHTGADGRPIELHALSEEEVNARLNELQNRYGPKLLAN